jgi:AcrR family transcriptional regulator
LKIEQNVQRSGGDPGAAIAAVAHARFRRFGYAKTSMQEIADDCDMSVANLYRYYECKLAIGATVAGAEQAGLFAGCDRAVAAEAGDATAKLITMFHALIDGTCRQIKSAPLLFELGMAVAREQPEHRQRILQETETRISAILAADGGGALVSNSAVEAESTRSRSQLRGSEASTAECRSTASDAGTAGRLILLASAPFVLPWMLRTQPFGNPRAQVEPLMRCLVSGLSRTTPPGVAPAVQPGGPR